MDHSMTVKVLLIGDIVAEVGRRMVCQQLLHLVQEQSVDLVIANGENAAGGFGITPKIAEELFRVGVHVITLGNHTWDKKEIIDYLPKEERLLRPANYPEGAPGSGRVVVTTATGERVGILHLVGRVFMAPLDCPFRRAKAELEILRSSTKMIVVDFHAEATSEKAAMGWYLDGEVSAVLGTHTHVQTADEEILPKGTAYITDVGMTGPTQSIIGVKREVVLERFITQIPRRLEPAVGPGQLSGVIVEIDRRSGRSLGIQRISIRESH
jgi:metallophosphoesterase (TIGR00282 family)